MFSPQAGGVGVKRWGDQERAVNPAQRCLQARWVGQVPLHRFGCSVVQGYVGLARIVDHGADLDAALAQRRHDQSGELAC